MSWIASSAHCSPGHLIAAARRQVISDPIIYGVYAGTEADALSLASVLLQRLDAGDTVAVAELFAASIDWFVPGSPALSWARRRSRRADVSECFCALWSHLEPGASVVDVSQIMVDGADAVVLVSFSHVAHNTGQRFSTPAALHLTVIDAETIRIHPYEDTSAIGDAWAVS